MQMQLLKIPAIAVLAAAFTIAAALPAAAYDGDSVPMTRVQRNWTGTGGSTFTSRHDRGSHGTTATVTVRPDDGRLRARDESPVTVRRDDDGWSNGWYGHRRHHDDGLDPAEVARIREAHRESDGHVTLRRYDDGDDYSVPSYETPSYHHRRHHWWSFWW